MTQYHQFFSQEIKQEKMKCICPHLKKREKCSEKLKLVFYGQLQIQTIIALPLSHRPMKQSVD